MFATRNDVLAEIAAAIEAGGEARSAEFDLDAIADDTYTFDTAQQAFVQTATETEFWSAVERPVR